jgi:hypothetical protein
MNNKFQTKNKKDLKPRQYVGKINQWLNKLYFNEKEKDNVVASVIVTASSSSKYDELFEKEKQNAPEGCRIALYHLDLKYISNFRDFLIKDIYPEDENICNTLKDLKHDLSEVEANCVLFNFECCQYFNKIDNGYGNNYIEEQNIEDEDEFSQNSIKSSNVNKITKKIDEHSHAYSFPDKQSTNDCLREFIKRGYYIMFADFSLKALINEWNEEILGPNPLVNIGCNNSKMMLEFDPEQLKNCESVQLQSVGKICPKGELKLSCMSETIVVGLDKTKIEDQKIYKYETLTIAINHEEYNPEDYNEKYMYYHLHGNRGTLGHASFKYESGSVLFVSAGHWIELHEIDSNVEDMKKFATENWGEDNEMQDELKEISQMKSDNNVEYIQKEKRLASQMIQKSVNCNFSKKSQVMQKSKMKKN